MNARGRQNWNPFSGRDIDQSRREDGVAIHDRAPAAASRLGVSCRILAAQYSGNKSSNGMALPHPESRKDKYGKEDKPDSRGVIGYFLKRTVDIPEDRNAKDDVNPAQNRPFGGISHHLIPFR